MLLVVVVLVVVVLVVVVLVVVVLVAAVLKLQRYQGDCGTDDSNIDGTAVLATICQTRY